MKHGKDYTIITMRMITKDTHYVELAVKDLDTLNTLDLNTNIALGSTAYDDSFEVYVYNGEEWG